jgi:hypothetical protein
MFDGDVASRVRIIDCEARASDVARVSNCANDSPGKSRFATTDITMQKNNLAPFEATAN